jgi:hypothetical protein
MVAIDGAEPVKTTFKETSLVFGDETGITKEMENVKRLRSPD